MLKNLVLSFVLAIAAFSAHADAPLNTSLSLDSDQAREISAIEAEVRKKFASIRQEHNRVMRAARRAGLAHDETEKVRLESEADVLLGQMQALRDDEESRIRKHLRADQSARYDEWLAEREAMHGSSRDATMLGAGR